MAQRVPDAQLAPPAYSPHRCWPSSPSEGCLSPAGKADRGSGRREHDEQRGALAGSGCSGGFAIVTMPRRMVTSRTVRILLVALLPLAALSLAIVPTSAVV